MYNSTGPLASGGLTGGVLAYTGSGSLVVPLVIAGLALALGVLLTIRARLLAAQA